jgi:hypothetical protein
MTTPHAPLPPFPSHGPIRRRRALPVGVDQAVAAAQAGGWQVTARSGPARVYVQRDWRTAATITPTPAGVVVKPAWTTGQMILVGMVLTLLVLGLCVQAMPDPVAP